MDNQYERSSAVKSPDADHLTAIRDARASIVAARQEMSEIDRRSGQPLYLQEAGKIETATARIALAEAEIALLDAQEKQRGTRPQS
jgi:hypothetical protein